VSLADWFGLARPKLAPEIEARVHAWKRNRDADLRVPLSEARLVVVDTETSGLDPTRSKLLSIGACLVEAGAHSLASTLEVFLRQEQASDTANILVHGIGHQRQTQGASPDEALAAFLEFSGKPLFVGYHALFDATALQRALRDILGVKLASAWLDLALVLPALFPEAGADGWELDRWLSHFHIQNFNRHGALADAVATTGLLLVAMARADKTGLHDPRALLAVQRLALDRINTAQSGSSVA
jgi:DNA polymerase III subunit epsilon